MLGPEPIIDYAKLKTKAEKEKAFARRLKWLDQLSALLIAENAKRAKPKPK